MVVVQRPGQQAFLRKHAVPLNHVVVATVVPTAPCNHASGDLNLLMGVLNKQDYARWHGYEFVLTALDEDAEVTIFVSVYCQYF